MIKCAFCDGGHRSGDCAVHTDADSRLKVVKENCLAKHPMAKCSSSNRCLKCKRKHDTRICNSQAGNQSSSTSSNETTTSETVVLHSNTNLPDNEVLLKTAIATIASACHVHAEACILFDEGAQKSFITEHLAAELQLTRETSETIYLASFGSTASKVQQVDIATVHVIAENRPGCANHFNAYKQQNTACSGATISART